ncbi:hypothetical protein [Frigoriglobus tundricola]|uniref:Lipoprotein n=1 Tax=Frigoriglobus tundricola TaxID=2774151 RepID=A0A6M5YXN3_9BACT|nr:hypothetical protein [Frigoriglobus tundricola]QJW97963.1 hypothetical protein FTUN_5543 [Frigoriglobus tundricola]
MSRIVAGKWARRAVWGALVAVLTIGCSPLSMLGFIFARPETVPAPYPLTLDKEAMKKKDEVVVLLLTQLAPGTGREFATADRDLASKLARQLPELAKEASKDKKLKMRVISPTQVDKFKMANPQWKAMSAGDIGQKLGADFALDIYLDKMRLYQPGSLNQIYEGRAEVSVSIFKIGADGSEFKDKYQLPFAYPRTGIRDTTSTQETEFRKLFLDNLTAEIIRQHVDSAPSSGIADGQ